MTGSTPPPAASPPTGLDSLGDWTRTHTCGQLAARDANTAVTLMGWVHRVRDHGGVLFIDLRDHYGLTQVVADPDSPAFQDAEKVRSEWVLDGLRGGAGVLSRK